MPVDLPALHDEADRLGDGDVLERVARYGDDVGQEPLVETPPVVDADQFGGDDGRGVDRLLGGHAPVDEGDELLGCLLYTSDAADE